jgi:hypothetical protein
MAQMLQQMQLGGFSQHDEEDCGWENLSYEMEQLKEAGKQGFTGGEIQALIVKHGMQPTHPLTDSVARRSMKFEEFMKICGSRGMTLMTKFEAMTLPDAPRKCNCCSKRGARMRCSNCGDTYCNSACQKKEWKDHRPVCRQAGRDHVCRALPKLFSWDEYDYRVREASSTSSWHQLQHIGPSATFVFAEYVSK